MKLGQKLLLIIIIGMLAVTLSVIGTTNIVAFDYIGREEQRDITKSYNNASLLLSAEARSLMRTLADRAQNDAAYQFIKNPSREYVIQKLTGDALSNLDINYVIYLNESANLVYLNTEGVAPSVRSREKGELLRRITEKKRVEPYPLMSLTWGLRLSRTNFSWWGEPPLRRLTPSKSPDTLLWRATLMRSLFRI